MRVIQTIRGVVFSVFLVLNTVFWSIILIYPLIALKLVAPTRGIRRFAERSMIRCGEGWADCNSAAIRMLPMTVDLQGVDNLNPKAKYLVSANHQTWMDTLLMQFVFVHRIPFLKFFLKKELIWIPIIGPVWWGLDFPFMKRHSKSAIERNPELRLQDFETTKRMCQRFVDQPVSIMNYLEGTRFTPAKHALQKSPYQNLLKPKAGGVGFVLSAMGESLESFLDVTIQYEPSGLRFWDCICGRVSHVSIHVQELSIPPEVQQGNYVEDPAYRSSVQTWVNDIWAAKDQRMSVAKSV